MAEQQCQQQQQEMERRSIPIMNKHPSTDEVLDEFGLRDFYKDKITIHEVMEKGGSGTGTGTGTGTGEAIRDPDHEEFPSQQQCQKGHNNSSQIFTLLYHIILLDSKARDRDILQSDNCIHDSNTKDDSDDIWFESNNDKDTSNCLHPLDCLTLILPVCDMSLQLLLFNKLFHCRLAVPLVIPNNYTGKYELALTPFSNITLESPNEKTGLISPHNAFDAPGQVLSFIKLEELGEFSKSGIANLLLTSESADSQHPTFSHRDSTNGQIDRIFSDGLVEVSWSLPRDRAPGQHNKTFLNLRGDAFNHPEQVKMMCSVSTLLICFIAKPSFNEARTLEYFSQIGPSSCTIMVVFITTKGEKVSIKPSFKESMTKLQQTLILKYDKAKGVAKFVQELHAKIEKTIGPGTVDTGSINTTTIESLSFYEAFDLDRDVYVREFDRAKNIATLFSNTPLECVKKQFLPLQAIHWPERSAYEKRCHRGLAGDITKLDMTQQEAMDLFEDKLNAIIEKQIRKLDCLDNLIKVFMEALDTGRNKSLFLHFLQCRLNARNFETLPSVMEKFRALQSEKADAATKEDIASIDQRLNETADTLLSASLGLEHFFREIGQIYESSLYTEDKDKYNYLVSATAKLVLEGQPLEIIDGDTGNMPIKWITAVLQQVKDMVQNKRVLVLAVIGIQSSGKSTLLNTMFGLQFAVSAGRCTKGVYMQLIPVINQPYEYVLVLDTEGLKSNEILDSQEKDNELATFIIGLGDVTLINIKGENVSEMVDVIQIAVAAFLRMVRVHDNYNSQKRCIFIHQNTPGVNVKAQNVTAANKLVSKLDEMTCEAAQHEKLKHIKFFNQVIGLDPANDVWYFPDFWQGNPPMGHVNPEYSKQVKQIRDSIFVKLQHVSANTFLTFASVIEYAQMLWEAIMKDDFVFTFKSCLEIKAKKSMDSEYRKLTQEAKREIFGHVRAVIENTESEILTNQSIADFEQKTMTELEIICEKLKIGLTQRFDQLRRSKSVGMIVIEWLPGKILLLNEEIERCKSQALVRVFTRLDDKRFMLETSKFEARQKATVINQAKKLSLSNRSDLNDESVIDKEFNRLWQKLAVPTNASLVNDIPSPHDQVKRDITVVLYEWFQSHSYFVREALDDKSLFDHPRQIARSFDANSLNMDDTCLNVVDRTTNERIHSGPDWKSLNDHILHKIRSALMPKLSDAVTSVLEATYDVSIIHELISIVTNWSKELFIYQKMQATVLPYMEIKLAVKACAWAFPNLCTIHDPHKLTRPHMQKYKEYLKKIFRDVCQSIDIHETLCSDICGRLASIIKRHITRKIKRTVKRQLNNHFGAKQNILRSALTFLAQKGDFATYLQYFNKPKQISCQAVQIALETYITSGDDAQNEAGRIIDVFRQSLNETSKEFTNVSMLATAEWLGFFVGKIQSKSIFKEQISFSIPEYCENELLLNLEQFAESMRSKLEEIVSDIVIEVKQAPLKVFGITPSLIERKVSNNWGCETNCPFCGEPCCDPNKNHTIEEKVLHRCLQHRPHITNPVSRGEDLKSMGIYNCNRHVAMRMGKQGLDMRSTSCGDWFIQPSPGVDMAQYWQWFVVHFADKISEHYSVNMFHIPPSWKRVTRETAVKSLTES